MKTLISLLALAAICSACTTNQSVSASVCDGELILVGYENVPQVADDKLIIKRLPLMLCIDENANKGAPAVQTQPELSI